MVEHNPKWSLWANIGPFCPPKECVEPWELGNPLDMGFRERFEWITGLAGWAAWAPWDLTNPENAQDLRKAVDELEFYVKGLSRRLDGRLAAIRNEQAERRISEVRDGE